MQRKTKPKPKPKSHEEINERFYSDSESARKGLNLITLRETERYMVHYSLRSSSEREIVEAYWVKSLKKGGYLLRELDIDKTFLLNEIVHGRTVPIKLPR